MSSVFLVDFFDIFTNPGKFVSDLIGEVVKIIVEGIINELWSILVSPLVQAFIMDPSDPIKPLGLDLTNLFTSFQYTAFGLLMALFMIRILKAMRDNLTDEAQTNYPELIGSFLVTCAFIFATPYIITEFLIPANTGMIDLITKTPIGNAGGVLDTLNKPNFTDVIQLPSDMNVWVQIILLIILFVVFIMLTFAGALRYVELILLYFVGPFIATTYLNRSSSYPSYWTDCIAVIFTQTVHFFLLKLAVALLPSGNILSTNGIARIVLMIAVVVVGIRGPQILRQYIHSTGVSGLAAKAGNSLKQMSGSAKGGRGKSSASSVSINVKQANHFKGGR